MKLHLLTALIVSCSLKDSSSQTVQKFTYSSKTLETLECIINTDTTNAEWSEAYSNGSTKATIFRYIEGNDIIPLSPSIDKYNNFGWDFVANTRFDLTIENVGKDDGGIYICSRFPSPGINSQTLLVEAIPEELIIICNRPASGTCGGPDEEALESSLDCECTATEISPESLMLQWSGSPFTVTKSNTSNPDPYVDLISKATVSPSSTRDESTCSVTGYQSEGIATSLVTTSYNFATPTCALSVDYDKKCTGGVAILTCDCTGTPEVDMYTFFYGNGSEIEGDKTINSRENVVIATGQATTLKCRGCNGVNFGDSSLSAVTICEPATTTMKPFKTTTVKPAGGPNALVIVFSCLGGIVALCGLAALIYFFCLRGPSTSSKGNNSVRDGESDIVPASNEETNSSAPLYGVVNKDKKKKSDDNTDGNGKNSTNSDPPEYAAVSKPLKTAEPKAAPRSSAPSAGGEPEKMELQYADIDHGNRGPSNEIRQPADAPTEYATVQSVIV